MRATAKLNDLNSDKSKNRIVRNLSRILDIRILDIDIEAHTISFVYDSLLAFEKVKRELGRIGFSVEQCSYQDIKRPSNSYQYEAKALTF